MREHRVCSQYLAFSIIVIFAYFNKVLDAGEKFWNPSLKYGHVIRVKREISGKSENQQGNEFKRSTSTFSTYSTSTKPVISTTFDANYGVVMAAWAISLVVIVGSLFLVLLFCVGIACLVIVCTRNHRRERTIVCPDGVRSDPGRLYIQDPAVLLSETQVRQADRGMAAEVGGLAVVESDNTYFQPKPPGTLATIAPPTYSATTMKMEKSGEDLEPPPYEDLTPREAPQSENDPEVADRITPK